MFAAYRRHQQEVPDHAAPCLLIDHPEMFRQIAREPSCRPAKNMAPGYLDGEIARAIDDSAAAWQAKLPDLSPHPALAEAPPQGTYQTTRASAAAEPPTHASA